MTGKLKIDLVCVGNIKEKSLREMCSEYEKRLTKYSHLKIIEVKDERNDITPQEVLKLEAKRLEKVIDQDSYIIICDLNCQMLSSEDLAEKFNEVTTYNNSKITFIIGGSHGIDQEIKRLSNYSLTISKMTFPHQLFRLIMLEQIYRAITINNNTPYHK